MSSEIAVIREDKSVRCIEKDLLIDHQMHARKSPTRLELVRMKTYVLSTQSCRGARVVALGGGLPTYKNSGPEKKWNKSSNRSSNLENEQ